MYFAFGLLFGIILNSCFLSFHQKCVVLLVLLSNVCFLCIFFFFLPLLFLYVFFWYFLPFGVRLLDCEYIRFVTSFAYFMLTQGKNILCFIRSWIPARRTQLLVLFQPIWRWIKMILFLYVCRSLSFTLAHCRIYFVRFFFVFSLVWIQFFFGTEQFNRNTIPFLFLPVYFSWCARFYLQAIHNTREKQQPYEISFFRARVCMNDKNTRILPIPQVSTQRVLFNETCWVFHLFYLPMEEFKQFSFLASNISNITGANRIVNIVFPACFIMLYGNAKSHFFLLASGKNEQRLREDKTDECLIWVNHKAFLSL